MLRCRASRPTRFRAGPGLVLLAVAALAPPSAADTVGPGLWRDGPGGLAPLPMLLSEVELDLTGAVLRGTVRQRFVNPTDGAADVVYLFPLPEAAAVDAMEMRIGDRRIVGEVRERSRARRHYAAARASGRQAALVEQAAGNLFRVAAAHVGTGQEVEVRLTYLEPVRYEDGAFTAVFPWTWTARYRPPSTRTAEAATVPAPRTHAGVGAPANPRARLVARITAGLPIADVVSPSHDVRVDWQGESCVVTPAGEFVPDRDFVLRWTPLAPGDPEPAAFVESRPDGRYVSVVVVPPRPAADVELGLATHTVFVIDVSGSMSGASLAQAKAALHAAVARVRSGDLLTLVSFADDVQVFSDRFVGTHPDEQAAAHRWIAALATRGGTRIYPALERAAALLDDTPGDAVRRVVLLTDGAVANEAELLHRIPYRLADARLHTLGIGAAPNGWLMRRMAATGRGVCAFVPALDEADNRIDAFLARIDRPVLADGELVWEGLQPTSVYPDVLPDLHAGEPLVVTARLPPGAGPEAVTLRGRVGDAWLERTVALVDAAPGSGVATLWARARADALIDAIVAGGDATPLREAIVELGTRFHLVTRFTSFVAVAAEPTAAGPSTPVRIASLTPAGAAPAPGRPGAAIGVLPRGGTGAPLRARFAVALALVALVAALCGWRS